MFEGEPELIRAPTYGYKIKAFIGPMYGFRFQSCHDPGLGPKSDMAKVNPIVPKQAS